MFEENNFTNDNQTANQTQQPPQSENNFNNSVGYAPYGFTPETYRQKKEIRRTAAAVGVPALCLSLVVYVWSFVYIFFTVNVAGMSYNSAVELSQDAAFQQVMQIILSCLMFLVPFPIAARCAGFKIGDLLKLGKPQKQTALPFILIGLGFCSFANIASSYSSSFFESFGIKYEVDYGENPSGVLGFLLTLIATAVVPALVEEFACRGIVLGMLRKHGDVFAIIASSVVFGVMHGNFDQMPFAIIIGLILGYVYVKTDSLWVSIALHFANNAVSVIMTYLSDIITRNNISNLIYMVYLIISLLVGILGICMLSKRGADVYTLKNQDTKEVEKNKYKWFFTSWLIIVFLVLNFIDSLAYFVI